MTATMQRPPVVGVQPDGPDLAHLNVALLGVVGSTAYKLAHAGSDVDRLGVYLEPTRDVLGLDGTALVRKTHVTYAPNPDSSVHEIGKLCALGLKANPTALELLWLPEYEICTPIGEQLLEHRSAFLSEPLVRKAFGAYADAQTQRLLNRIGDGSTPSKPVPATRAAKHARHCLRIVRQGRTLLETGEMSLDFSAQREELEAAGLRATTDPDWFHDLMRRERDLLHGVRSPLPPEPDRATINTLLSDARLASHF